MKKIIIIAGLLLCFLSSIAQPEQFLECFSDSIFSTVNCRNCRAFQTDVFKGKGVRINTDSTESFSVVLCPITIVENRGLYTLKGSQETSYSINLQRFTTLNDSIDLINKIDSCACFSGQEVGVDTFLTDVVFTDSVLTFTLKGGGTLQEVIPQYKDVDTIPVQVEFIGRDINITLSSGQVLTATLPADANTNIANTDLTQTSPIRTYTGVAGGLIQFVNNTAFIVTSSDPLNQLNVNSFGVTVQALGNNDDIDIIAKDELRLRADDEIVIVNPLPKTQDQKYYLVRDSITGVLKEMQDIDTIPIQIYAQGETIYLVRSSGDTLTGNFPVYDDVDIEPINMIYAGNDSLYINFTQGVQLTTYIPRGDDDTDTRIEYTDVSGGNINFRVKNVLTNATISTFTIPTNLIAPVQDIQPGQGIDITVSGTTRTIIAEFDGRYDGLDFTGTTGLSDGIDNVGITTESDPVWLSEKTNYFTKTEQSGWDQDASDDFSGNYNDLSNKLWNLNADNFLTTANDKYKIGLYNHVSTVPSGTDAIYGYNSFSHQLDSMTAVVGNNILDPHGLIAGQYHGVKLYSANINAATNPKFAINDYTKIHIQKSNGFIGIGGVNPSHAVTLFPETKIAGNTVFQENGTVDFQKLYGGNANASAGSEILVARYTNEDNYFISLGTLRSSGAGFLGYGVKASKTVGNGFESSTSASIPRSAIVFGEFGKIKFLGASTQAQSIGNPMTLNTGPVFESNGFAGFGGVENADYPITVTGGIRTTDITGKYATLSGGILGATNTIPYSDITGAPSVTQLWTASGSDIYRNSSVAIGSTSIDANSRLNITNSSSLFNTTFKSTGLTSAVAWQNSTTGYLGSDGLQMSVFGNDAVLNFKEASSTIGLYINNTANIDLESDKVVIHKPIEIRNNQNGVGNEHSDFTTYKRDNERIIHWSGNATQYLHIQTNINPDGDETMFTISTEGHFDIDEGLMTGGMSGWAIFPGVGTDATFMMRPGFEYVEDFWDTTNYYVGSNGNIYLRLRVGTGTANNSGMLIFSTVGGKNTIGTTGEAPKILSHTFSNTLSL